MKAAGKKGLCFDPRSKLAAVVTMSIITMGGFYQSGFHYLPAVLPLLLFLSSKQWLSSLRYAGCCFLLCWGVAGVFTAKVSGCRRIFAGGAVYDASLFSSHHWGSAVPDQNHHRRGICGSHGKMHMPNGFTVSVAMIFRFFPTLMEEWRAISDAMKMRGVGLFTPKAGKYLEYKLVPMLMRRVSIGEELSAAALTIGLDSECSRTSIHKVCITWQDTVLLIICFGVLSSP